MKVMHLFNYCSMLVATENLPAQLWPQTEVLQMTLALGHISMQKSTGPVRLTLEVNKLS